MLQNNNNNNNENPLIVDNIITPTNSFSFIVQNIRSMRANFDLFIAELNVLENSPLFIFLTEIFIFDYEVDNYNINNYVSFANCNNSYKSGGVLVFSRSDVKCKSTSEKLYSADILRLDTDIDGEHIVFVCVYRLHRCCVDAFNKEFMIYLDKIKCKNLIIVGDLNINILEENNALCQDYLSLMSSFGLMSNVNEVTRPSSGTCIDHVFSRLSLYCSLIVNVFNTNITDHCTLVCRINLMKCTSSSNKLKVSNKKIINYESLTEDLEKENWADVYKEIDPNIAYDIFIHKLKILIEHNSKTTILNNKKKLTKLKPWITNCLVKKINVKNTISKKLKRKPSNINLISALKSLSKEIKVETARAKENYYKKKFKDNGHDSRKNWCLVNEIISNNSSKSSYPVEILSTSNNILSNSLDIANDFNDFFVNIGNTLRPQSVACENINLKVVEKTFFFRPISPIELCKIVDALENKASLDFDDISNVLLKNIFIYIADVVSHIFNLSFTNGVVPDRLKVAVVIPLFKKGNHKLKENYRPISLLPIFSKLLEKALKLRMMNFLDEMNFFNNSQYGFRENLNTEFALIEFLNDVYSSLNNNMKCVSIFVDIKKAFDMVDHKLLLDVLYSSGFRGTTLNWFTSYFEHRKQCVKIDGMISSFKDLTIGVPQGSVLGPIFFIVYLNSIFSLPLSGKAVAFADDMAFIYSNIELNTVVGQINNDLNILKNWFQYHGLLLSEKTKSMVFKVSGDPVVGDIGLKYHNSECTSNICSSKCLSIECVSVFKYLGVYLDHNLNWKIQLKYLKKYFNTLLCKFYLLRRLCPFKILKAVYFSLVQSKLEYGITCWGGAYKNCIKPVRTLQKHFIRLMTFNSRFSSSWPIFKKNCILPLRHLYLYKVLKMFFNRSGNRCIKHLKYNSRSNNQYTCNVPRSKTEHFRRYYLSIAPTVFNKLPLSVRKCENPRVFLREIKDWLFNNSDAEELLKT